MQRRLSRLKSGPRRLLPAASLPFCDASLTFRACTHTHTPPPPVSHLSPPHNLVVPPPTLLHVSLWLLCLRCTAGRLKQPLADSPRPPPHPPPHSQHPFHFVHSTSHARVHAGTPGVLPSFLLHLLLLHCRSFCPAGRQVVARSVEALEIPRWPSVHTPSKGLELFFFLLRCQGLTRD